MVAAIKKYCSAFVCKVGYWFYRQTSCAQFPIFVMSAVASLWLRHASHYLTLATPRPPNYNIIPFYSVTTFQSKKQKMFRYPHIIYILIHISILFVSRTTLYGTKLHEVARSVNFV